MLFKADYAHGYAENHSSNSIKFYDFHSAGRPGGLVVALECYY